MLCGTVTILLITKMTYQGSGKTTEERDHIMVDKNVEITKENLKKYGHFKRPLLKVIRENCIDCMGGIASDVKGCEITNCSFWPYRLNKNPFYKSNSKGNSEVLKKWREEHNDQ